MHNEREDLNVYYIVKMVLNYYAHQFILKTQISVDESNVQKSSQAGSYGQNYILLPEVEDYGIFTFGVCAS